MNKEKALIEDLESKTAQEILKWALEEYEDYEGYEDKVALASSFGAEDVVLIDMIVKIHHELRNANYEPQIFTIDTGRLPQETYDLMDEIREKYNIQFEVYYPDTKSVEEMVFQHGLNLFYKSVEMRQLCCKVRKVEPLNRALKKLAAWICGLRREQSITRTKIGIIEVGEAENSITKINPLANWTEEQVWDYIKKNDVPYNTLHDKGYPSIGCAPCTRVIKPGEDIRAGRWWWESPEKKECGLHHKKP